ncbi:MAG: DUF1080 domain-containing protein [Acidobacteriota bacterium]|nr:MAG: DUF1080 domain-containing protein [Acidobacteriota bacterium]
MKKRYFMVLLVTLACIVFGIGQKVQFPTNAPEGPVNQLSADEKADGWVLLFNGSDLSGWEHDQGEWRVENGMIVSSNGPGHLFTQNKYADVEVEWDLCAYDIAVPKRRFGNSGVFLRAIKTGENYPQGYEVQVDPYDLKNPTGGIYGMAAGNLLVDGFGRWKQGAFFDVHEGKWIHQRARIEGSRIQVWVNGEKTLDWTDPENRFAKPGYIALQNHHKTDVVLFSSIKLRELK